MSLILKENYPNLTVVNLENGISFVHDNKTGKNYFSNKMIAEACGTDESNVRRYWSNFKEKRNNVLNSHVVLKVANVKQGVDFKSFDFFNYVSNRVNTKEALQMQEYISDAIDEKFNKDVGFKKPLVDKLSDALNIDKVTFAERNKELESQVRTTSKINLNMTNQLSLSKQALEEAERAIKRYENEVNRLKQYEEKYKHRRTQKPVVKEVVVHMTLDEYMKTNGGDINEL